MPEVREQRPQDQGLSETSAGSPAWSASPSSGSSSSTSYRKTRRLPAIYPDWRTLWTSGNASPTLHKASCGRRGGVPACAGKQRREEQAEQQSPAPQGPALPPPPPVDYGVFMQGLVQAMQTQAHTQATLQAQLEAQALSAACRQEGEMEQYLEEKKASQKRPAAPFQRQDKKKAAYQSPQRPVAASSTQVDRYSVPEGGIAEDNILEE
ncbi:hypothetical protein Taro_018305 [Colocasia esculenta]|uniref:Uncharacterized protein n=1 Tax=Colocasia esculenta TaxID=4460 RepID=A0A843V207_COLES|nr:hypothetical protein [Colocasia esculenta]